MSPSFRLKSIGATLAALAAVSIAGCGAGDHDSGMPNWWPGGKFGTATREKVASDPEGLSFRIAVESKSKAHWYEAWSAMSRDNMPLCTDGVPFSIVKMTPTHDPRQMEPGSYLTYPAGTVFTQEIRCSTPFANERRLAADADHTASLAALKAELVGDSDYSQDRQLHASVSYNDRVPKYRAVTEMVGGMLLGVNRRCRDAGVRIQRIVIHSKPTPDPAEGVFLNRSEAFVGIDAVCADALPADPRF